MPGRLSNHEREKTRTSDPYRVKVVLYQLSYALESNDERGTMNDEVKTGTELPSVHRSSFLLHRFKAGDEI